ncbi:MAG: hypothetical protein RLZZ557_1455 [Bacteroidota bacterium]|jgi:hypothetical protein
MSLKLLLSMPGDGSEWFILISLGYIISIFYFLFHIHKNSRKTAKLLYTIAILLEKQNNSKEETKVDLKSIYESAEKI